MRKLTSNEIFFCMASRHCDQVFFFFSGHNLNITNNNLAVLGIRTGEVTHYKYDLNKTFNKTRFY